MYTQYLDGSHACQYYTHLYYRWLSGQPFTYTQLLCDVNVNLLIDYEFQFAYTHTRIT